MNNLKKFANERGKLNSADVKDIKQLKDEILKDIRLKFRNNSIASSEFQSIKNEFDEQLKTHFHECNQRVIEAENGLRGLRKSKSDEIEEVRKELNEHLSNTQTELIKINTSIKQQIEELVQKQKHQAIINSQDSSKSDSL